MGVYIFFKGKQKKNSMIDYLLSFKKGSPVDVIIILETFSKSH